jgi:FlaA1/EpsC-like NDP-sugar epimerase
MGDNVFKEIECIGKLRDLKGAVRKHGVDEIIIAIDNISYDNLMGLIDNCNELDRSVKLTSELFNIVPEKIVTESYSGIPVVDLSPKVNRNLNYIKVFDYIAAFFIVLLLPFFLNNFNFGETFFTGEIFSHKYSWRR